MLIDLTDVDASQRWIAINDGVMGGITVMHKATAQ